MLSSQLKSDIRQLWDAFWAGGIANPLTAIEQITYLVFLKRLEDLDTQRAREAEQASRPYRSIFDVENGESYRWSYIKGLENDEKRLNHVRGPVFEWLKSIEVGKNKERMRDAVFVIPSPNLLKRAVEIIDGLFIPERNQDTLGDIYEMLLAEIAEGGKNGQFRTPRHIIRAMCDLVDPRLDERICDPSCGTGGFLINAYQHILKSNTSRHTLRFATDGTPLNATGDKLTEEERDALRHNHFYGFDFDRTMVRLGWMNMIQHGLQNPQIYYGDTLGKRFNQRLDPEHGDLYESFNVVLANPPYSGQLDKNNIGKTLEWLGRTRTDLLFIELILQLLKPSGRAAVIVPEGLLFRSTRAHKAIRKKLVEENQLKAIISLPGGVFQPYTGVKTSILLFTKGGSTKEVWFYEVEQDGYSLNAKRSEQPERNDLWDMTLKYRLRYGAAPPAFVDGSTWQAWQAFSEKERSHRYIQPVLEDSPQEENQDEQVVIRQLAELKTVELSEPKDWVADTSETSENEHNLTAGRYKPFVLKTVDFGSPLEIIKELEELEDKIQKGLANLRAMVEGVA